MDSKKHLRLDMHGQADAGEMRHAQEVMRELGIEYTYAVPQSIFDCWWFLGCTDVPDELPAFITEMKRFDPYKAIGHGLDQEMADTLTGHEGDGK